MKFTTFFCAVLFCAAASASPYCQWDFEKPGNKENIVLSADGKFRLYAVPVPGFKGRGTALNSRKRVATGFPMAASWKSFTFEMKFRLDKGIDKRSGNALICYAKHSWNRSQFVLKITPKNQLEARFTQDARKKELFLASKVLKFETGKFYTVRVASQDEGPLKIWLDGELVAMREKGSWGFNRLVRKSPAGYPLLTFGNDIANISSIYRPLNGVADDIKIWNKFKEPDLIGDLPAASGTGALLVPADKTVSTEKFTVLDRPGTALGSFIRPEQKFLDAAANADITLTAKELIVKVKAPIAPGTKLFFRPGATWGGDVIEFFFCPDPAKGEYFQYGANVSGFKAAMAFTPGGTLKNTFKSQSTIKSRTFADRWEAEFIIPRHEIGLSGNIDGKISTANFTRSGQTGGGQSTWAPVGSTFHNPTRFRKIVFGSFKSALLKKLAASRQEFNAIKGKAELKKSIAAELDTIEKRIKSDKGTSETFAPLATAIDRMVLRYTQLKFSGTPNLFWRPDLPWGNDIHVSPLSRPLKKISLVLPQNSFTCFGFVFSNLSTVPFLGQLKCFPAERLQKKRVYNSFNSNIYGDTSPVYSRVEFFEALPLIAGGVFHDPLLPLPMNTLLRAAANESKQVWMRFSSKAMKPGKYNFVMVLKPSYNGFLPIEVPFEVEIRNVDLKDIKLDSFHYTYINSRSPHKDLIGFLAKKELNVIYSGAAFGQSRMNVYPLADKQGNILRYADYAELDNLIEAKIKAGIEKERIKLLCLLELPTWGMARQGNSLKFNTPPWKKAFKSFLIHFTDHMEKKYGITKDRIFFYTMDEPDGDIDLPSSRMYLAYLSGKIIKEAGKEFRTMVNPHPNYLRGKNLSAMKKLAEVYDVFELYRPALGSEQIAAAKSLKREIWTYGIYGKTVSPELYRREYWQSLRDGFSSMIAYWHLEGHAGDDGFNSEDGIRNRADYGSIFADLDMGTVLTSRREEAHALGMEDFKLAVFCRNALKKAPDAALQKQLDGIILKGSYADMTGMEQCRLQLLALAEKLAARKK